MANDEIQRRLEEAFAASGLTQAALSRASGIDRSSISLYLSGRYKPKADKLLRLAAALSVTPEWLSGMEANAPEPSALLPVAQELDEQGGLRFTEERVPVPRSFLHGGDCGSFFILRVTGLAMYPRLLSGDCLLVEKTAEPKDGAIAVLVQDGALLVRTVSGKTLLPANPEYPPRALDHTARILGRAVMLVRAL